MSEAAARHAELLGRVELLADLDRVALAKLAARLEAVPVARGAVVFREGDPGDAFYLVARGAFGIYVTPEGEEVARRLATLGPGAPFGEMALLGNRPRSATVRADGEGEVLRLERAHFLDLVRREPAVALAIAARLSVRLAAAQRQGADTGSRMESPAGLAPGLGGLRAARGDGRAGSGRRTAAGLGLGLAILGLSWLTGPSGGVGEAGWRAAATLVAMVPVLALEALPEGVLALAVPALWVVGGIVPPRVALAGFASSSFVLVVAVLAVGAGIGASGLLFRLALWTVSRARGGFAGQALALAAAGALIGPAIPNATSRVTLIAPVLSELIGALGYAPRSPGAAGLAMAALVGFGQTTALFLTSSTTAVLVFAVLPAEVRADLDWATWAVRAAPTGLLLLLGMVGAVVWLYRPRAAGDRAEPRPGALLLQRAILGAPTAREWSALAVGAALLLGLAAQPLHGVEPAWLAALAVAVLAAAGVVTGETLRSLNWGFALFFGMLASLSEVFAATGVDRHLAGLVARTVGGLAREPALFVLALGLVCVPLSLLVRWQAAAPILTLALSPVALASGIDPFVVGQVALLACNGFLVPYQSTVYLALYHGSEGRLFTHRQARAAALAYVVVTLAALLLSVPAWRALGLL